jgi:L-ascorbate metabolism protein UlaG (beta-lactamase superfamily)
MDIGNVSLKWLGHAGFLVRSSTKGTPSAYLDKSSSKISTGGKIIYIDPYQIQEGSPKADLILLTHSHYDHCSFEDIEKIIQEGTRIICPADCQSKVVRFKVPIKIEVVEPGKEIDFGNVRIIVFPSYNVDKHFHPKEEGWVGYLIKVDDVLIYHAGDSDVIPEMQKLTGHKHSGKKFVALLPIGGRFTMSAEEAVEAAKMIKPDIAIPMHWGSVIGSKDDAQEFKELCEDEGIKVKILEREQ